MYSLFFSILNRYFCRYFLFWFFCCLAIIICIVSLFEGVELLRRSTAHHYLPLSLIGEMMFLKIPAHLDILLPFITFFATSLSLWKLNQTREIMIATASGLSPWQFIIGLNAAIVLIYSFYLGIINPVGAAMINRYKQLEQLHFKSVSPALALASNGLWLSERKGGSRTLIHARDFNLKQNWFKDITFYDFNEQGELTNRQDAKQAKLVGTQIDTKWELQQVYSWASVPQHPQFEAHCSRPALFSLEKIEENYDLPQTLSFWEIRSIIEDLKKAGLSSRRYELYWHKQIAKGGLMLAMSFLSLLFARLSHHQRNSASLLGLGCCVGFVIYFTSDIVYALGMAEKLPILLSVWLVPLIVFLLSSTFLLHIEHPSK